VLDIRLIRDRPEEIERALAEKGGAALVKELVASDVVRRRLIHESEELKAEHGRASQEMGKKQGAGGIPADVREAMRARSDKIKMLDTQVKEADEKVHALLLEIPNVPHPSVPRGTSDADNVEVRRWGTPRVFDFPPKPHEEVGMARELLDLERAVKLSKARFAVLWGALARLERALGQFMLDLHLREHGYTELWLPHLVNAETMLQTGQLPKFEEGLFKTVEADDNRTLYLIPTAEVPLSALHSGEVLAASDLPRRYTALTPSYRREAGTYGKDMKGIYRQHQFDKVELVKIASPAQSYDELESMVANAEEVLRRLELPYRVVERCTGDVGFSAAKGYDVEVWRPALEKYTEISSCSNYADFGGRRVDIRFRPEGGGRPEFCHTLNGSGLAVGRTLIAVLENYQEADGSVTIPKVVQPYMSGLERIEPKQ
jgi:seryl-tRNA synthetase